MMKLLILLFGIVAVTSACQDKISYSCDSWKSKGYCDPDHFHSDYVRDKCEKTCGVCGGNGGNSACFDTHQNCAAWKDQYCSSNKWVQDNCQKTCDLCNGGNGGSGGNGGNDGNGGNGGNGGACGKPQIAMSRVVGGKTAKAHSWPWQIAMLYNGGFNCGGSLVNNKWIVTASHCVDRKSARYFKVVLGKHDRNRRESGEQTIQVKRIIMHPQYNSRRQLNNDIALMELETPAKLTETVHPICLPSKGEAPRVGSQCYITGWGKIRHPGGSHHILQQLGMQVQSKSACNAKNSKYFPITDQMICGANPRATSNQSGCHGDSGGPFVCESNGKWTLHGAVSWGSPRCSASDSYTVFARVAQFRDWIDNYIN